MPSYRFIARMWCVVFVVVGCLFLLVPDRLARLLTESGGALGLSGTIVAAPATLWHVLALSLMGALACLAWLAAREPGERAFGTVIVVAKGISVAGFIALSAAHGSIWLLCAGADAFVAATLLATRPPGRAPSR
ncbi:MAG: hypothetical protein IT294_16660 [Deltaproteobacteria bacterium]|nr:hypothetical protein [Deltaproteobacteria bacterium]